MANETGERKAVITILLVSTLLTTMGIAGVLRGAYDLSSKPIPEDLRELYSPDAEIPDIQIRLLEAQLSNPYRRPMAAANMIVSSLVLVGSFLLSWRRKLAQWWIRQAVVAKLIWIVAYTITLVQHIKLSLSTVAFDSDGLGLQEAIATVLVLSFASAALHVAAAYRASRPDIRELIDAKGKA